MKAMILAAGRGERMRPLTDHTPKPLLMVGNMRLIEYHLYKLAENNFNEVVINIAHLGDQVQAILGDGRAYGLTIHYSNEGHEALETGGGIVNALALLGEQPFLVINGDIWCDYPFVTKTIADEDLAHLVLVDNPEHNPQGDFSFENKRVAPGNYNKLTFSGIAYYRPEFFSGYTSGKFPLLPLLQNAINAGRVSAEHYRGEWHDVGTPQRLQQLTAQLASR